MTPRRFSLSSSQALSRLTKSSRAARSALGVFHTRSTRSSISRSGRLPMIRVWIEISPDAGLEIVQQPLDGGALSMPSALRLDRTANILWSKNRQGGWSALGSGSRNSRVVGSLLDEAAYEWAPRDFLGDDDDGLRAVSRRYARSGDRHPFRRRCGAGRGDPR